MAPENVPSIVVFNSRIDNETLVGSVEYIEPTETSQRIRVRWAVEERPDDFDPIGDGVAYIHNKVAKVDIVAISEDARPNQIGESRYQWTEGMQHGQSWLMFILILPEGYTINNPEPNPAGTKNFKGRIAIYWILRGDDIGRTKVEWDMKMFRRELEDEITHINREYLTSRSVSASTITVEDASNSKNRSRQPSPWSSGSFYLISFVVIAIVLFLLARYISIWSLPVVIIGTILVMAIIGALQLRQDDRLSEKSFIELMALTFKRLPLLSQGTKESRDD